MDCTLSFQERPGVRSIGPKYKRRLIDAFYVHMNQLAYLLLRRAVALLVFRAALLLGLGLGGGIMSFTIPTTLPSGSAKRANVTILGISVTGNTTFPPRLTALSRHA